MNVRLALFRRHRLTITGEPFLLVEGALQHEDEIAAYEASHPGPVATTAIP